jgi:hypothetical protein
VYVENKKPNSYFPLLEKGKGTAGLSKEIKITTAFEGKDKLNQL